MRYRWVWFDLENTPQVLFLEPIIRHVREAGWDVGVTAKPQAQTEELAAARGLAADVVGSGDFVGRLAKVVGGGGRAVRLAAWVFARGRPRLLVSSSRSASLTAVLLRIPQVGLMDYEHAHHTTIAMASTSLWMPDALRDVRFGRRTRRVARFYAGLKENLYLDSWRFDRVAERGKLGVGGGARVVVARPPATSAHYAPRAEPPAWVEAVFTLAGRPDVVVLVVPRNASQKAELTRRFVDVEAVRILQNVTPGPGLVAAADLVVGGGGTMNREAAVLGVPVWSAFAGPASRIDELLASEGRLQWIRSPAELSRALAASWPDRPAPRGPFPDGLRAILGDVTRFLN